MQMKVLAKRLFTRIGKTNVLSQPFKVSMQGSRYTPVAKGHPYTYDSRQTAQTHALCRHSYYQPSP